MRFFADQLKSLIQRMRFYEKSSRVQRFAIGMRQYVVPLHLFVIRKHQNVDPLHWFFMRTQENVDPLHRFFMRTHENVDPLHRFFIGKQPDDISGL